MEFSILKRFNLNSSNKDPPGLANYRPRKSGQRSVSPRPLHSTPQFQPQQSHPQQQSIYGYQHHNNFKNQFRRPSAPGGAPFQPVQRQFYPPQQDFGMYTFAHVAFPPQPTMFPGYVYEPVNAITAQV